MTNARGGSVAIRAPCTATTEKEMAGYVALLALIIPRHVLHSKTPDSATQIPSRAENCARPMPTMAAYVSEFGAADGLPVSAPEAATALERGIADALTSLGTRSRVRLDNSAEATIIDIPLYAPPSSGR